MKQLSGLDVTLQDQLLLNKEQQNMDYLMELESELQKKQLLLAADEMPLLRECAFFKSEDGFMHPNRILDFDVLIHYHGTDSIKGCKALCFAIVFPVDFAFQINHKFPASELYLNKIPVSSSLAIDKKSYDFPCLNMVVIIMERREIHL